MRIFAARWLLPVVSPPLLDGAVATEGGRIVAVGRRTELLRSHGARASCSDLGDVVLLPGLVNAHTHVELSWMGSDPPRGADPAAWVRELITRRAGEDAEVAQLAAERAVAFMVRRGTAAVGDVANDPRVAPILARSTLSGVLFHEVYGFRSADAEGLFAGALERTEAMREEIQLGAAAGKWQVVPTAHAPHTTSAPLLRALGRHAAASGQPFSIHVAESEAECALLHDGSGPFGELLRDRGVWDETFQAPRTTPVEYLDRLGLLTERTLAVHCVHVNGADRTRLRERGVAVVACTRSNEQLGAGRAPIPDLLREGIPVALGTDSLASAPDLDLFAEMAALRRAYPEVSPTEVLRMATLNGAAALGLADRLGSLEPGKQDRLVALPMASSNDDPLEIVCSRPVEVRWLTEFDGRVA